MSSKKAAAPTKETIEKQQKADEQLWWILSDDKAIADKQRAWWKSLTVSEKKWWWAVKDYALRTEEASIATVKISDPGRIWGWSVDFIYLHWAQIAAKAPQIVLTDVSPERLQASMKRCNRPHPDRDLPPTFLRWGCRAYIEECKRVTISEVQKQQHLYLEGYEDPSGNWWCGRCFPSYRVMCLGEELYYSEMYDLYPHEDTQGVEDETGWLAVAMNSDALVLDRVITGAQAATASDRKVGGEKCLKSV